MPNDPKRNPQDDKPDVGGKDELAENAENRGESVGEDAVEEYSEDEASYSRDPDSVDSERP